VNGVFAARVTAICGEMMADTVVFTEHALMNILFGHDKPNEDDIAGAVCDPMAEILEDYPRDTPFPSSLIWSVVRPRYIHVVSTYPPNPVRIVTAYWPDTQPGKWADAECRVRA
jgi:hypothetical protein